MIHNLLTEYRNDLLLISRKEPFFRTIFSTHKHIGIIELV